MGEIRQEQGDSRNGGPVGSGSRDEAGLVAAAPLTRTIEFAVELMSMAWQGDVDSEDVQTIAQKHGVITAVPFDAAKHSDHYGIGMSDGDEWFVVAPDIVAARQRTPPPSSRGDQ